MSPIRPENKHLYPDNWKEIRAAILERACNKCELCGVANGERHPYTDSIVVLTIMHLDHDPTNNDPANLKAGCQRCHNKYDMPTRVKNRKIRTRKEKEQAGQLSFDDK